MRVRNQFVIAIISLLVCCACHSRLTNNLVAFERFVQNVEKDAPNYTSEDWKIKDNTFKDFIENRLDKNKNNFTAEQMRKIGELEARYYKVRVKYAGKGVIDDLEKEWEYIKGFGGEIINEFQ